MRCAFSSRLCSLLFYAAVGATLGGCGGGNGSDGYNGPFPTYPIDGTITSAVTGQGIANVTVKLSGILSGTAITDSSGHYHFGRLTVGYYTVTPVMPDAVLTPAYRNLNIIDSNAAGQDFSAARHDTVATGIGFTPGAISSANQLRASVIVAGSDLVYSDSSDAPLKKLSLTDHGTTTLAARFGNAESAVLHGGRVYWVDGGRLNQTTLAGATSVLAQGERDASAGVTADVVVDDTYAYWVNTLASSGCSPSCTWVIQRVPLAGGAPVTLATVHRRVVALAADATQIYWEEAMLEPVTPGCQCGSSIKTVPKAGGATVVLVDGLLNGTLPPVSPGYVAASWLPTGGLAVTPGQVIFAVAGGSYQVESVPPAGGAPTVLVSVPSSAGSALNAIRGLTADGDRVYWIDSTAGTLDAVPLTGGGITVLASSLALPQDLNVPVALAITPTSALWTEPGTYDGCCLQMGTGRIRQVSLAGGPASTVVAALDAPGALAVDAGNLVWTETWRVARAAPDGSAGATLASGIGSDLARIAVDQVNVYVLDGDLIKKVPLAGGRVEKLAPAHGGSIADLSAQNMDIATDGRAVYWTVNGIASAVQKIATTGTGLTTLVSGVLGPPIQDCYWRISVDAHNVYWSAGSSTHPVGCVVNSVPLAGGAVTTLLDQAYLRDFTIDASSLYYSELASGSGSIQRMPLGGGAAAPVATDIVAWVLVNDAGNLYWIDPRLGGVSEITKSSGAQVVSLPFPLQMDPIDVAEGLVASPAGLFVTETPAGRIDRLY